MAATASNEGDGGSMRWKASWENRVLIWMGAVALLLGALAWWLPRGTGVLALVSDDARNLLTFSLFRIGALSVTPIFLIKGMIYLALLSVISSMTRKALYRRVETGTALGAQHSYVLARFASIVVYTLGLTVGLESAGLNLNSLAIVGGTLGIGVGFGLQPVVANWVAGLVLLVEAPFRIGDRIDVGDTSGVVVRVGGRSTWVRTYDNEVIIVPNSEFTTKRVTNWTVNDLKVRLKIEVGVDCASNLEQVKESLVAIAKRHPAVLPDPPPEAVLVTLGDSSWNFYLRFWTLIRDHDNYALLSDLYCVVIEDFAKQGIVMPYPQQDVHVRSVDSPVVIASGAGRVGG
jgi:small-conductance mechanosensitive channel